MRSTLLQVPELLDMTDHLNVRSEPPETLYKSTKAQVHGEFFSVAGSVTAYAF
jgi:hypothetical protein